MDMKIALLLLEIQNDYFPNGRMPLEKSCEAAANAQIVLQVFREAKLPIIHMQHISTQPDAAFLLPCTKGAEFYAAVQPSQNETIIKKHYHNSFKDTGLLNHLIKQRINHLLICGMMTHTTIDATTRAAYDLGFNCTILHDACTAQALEFGQIRLSEEQVHFSSLATLQSPYAHLCNIQQFMQRVERRIPVEA
jgi:nicotinamidase-related amidase